MSEKYSVEQEIVAINQKLEDIDKHIDILHGSMKDLNGAVDMLVRFSMTSKAFMELSISQGIIDPYELNKLASQYEMSYSANLGVPNESTEYSFKRKRFSI